MNETKFSAQVQTLARLCGWSTHHTHDSRGSADGFPALVMVRGPRLIFAELKTDAKSSRLTPEQKEWIDALGVVEDELPLPDDAYPLRIAPVLVFVWRPADWGSIEKTLR